MNLNIKKSGTEPLYMEVHQYYKNLILSGQLSPGSKMPSLRKCAQELGFSRTTIESAYLQLAADGFIIAKAQSGYYVTDIAKRRSGKSMPAPHTDRKYRYDFASSGADRESFRFDLWRRYIKSALRQDERLLSYGESQGENDLREALSDYVYKNRNIVCSPEQIVIGAGTQSLLQILCPLIQKKKTVSFPTVSFIQGSTVFSDYGFQIHYRDKNCDVIYVSPAHMTKWGEIMPVSRRMELLEHAAERESLIIEDDFENEFVYLQKPTPSLFSLDGGRNVVYMGSFSKLLLPSIRISFMILPPSLMQLYEKKAGNYNQTASKAEQIALCQFIRDGHLASQARRLRRLYLAKLKLLLEAVRDTFGDNCHIQIGSAGTSLALTISSTLSGAELKKNAQSHALRLSVLREAPGELTLILSCSSMPSKDFLPACRLLKEIIGNP